MATQVTKRVATVFLDGAQPAKSMKELQATATKLYNELRKLPRGTDEFVAKAKEYQQVKKELQSVKDEVAGSNTVFGSLQRTLGPMAGAMGLAFGGAAAIAGIQRSREEFLEHEKAVDRVTQALRNNGTQSGQTAAGLSEAADALELDSLHSAEEILNQVSTPLLNFGTIADEQFRRAQQASIDLATTMNGDLQGATMAIGKALNSPAEGLAKLGKMGIVFSEEQKKVVSSLVETGHAAEAQDLILAELEKRFAGQAAAAAKNEQGTRALDQAMGDFVEGAGGFFNEALQDIAGGAADVLKVMGEWMGLTHKQSDELQGQRIEMNALFNVLKDGNVTSEQQAELVNRINTEYGAWLPRSISVTDSVQDLTQAQNAANGAMLEHIQLLAKQELLQEAQDDAVDQQKDALEAQLKLNKVMQGEITLWDRIKTGTLTGAGALPFYTVQAKLAKEQAAEAAKEYENLVGTLGSVTDAQQAVDANAPRSIGTAPAQGGDEADQATERATKVRDALRSAHKDIEMDRMGDMAREIRQVEDKYQKLAEEADGSGVTIEEIETQQAEELQSVRRKYGEKEVERLRQLDADIRKLRDEQLAARLDVESKQEVDAINAKYDAQREAAAGNAEQLATIENERRSEVEAVLEEQRTERQAMSDEAELQRVRDKYAKLLDEAKGHGSRQLELQDLMAIELEAKELEQERLRQDRLLAKQQAEDEWQAQVDQLKLDQAQKDLDLMTARHENELAGMEGQGVGIAELMTRQAEEKMALQETLRQAERDAINTHFEDLYAQADAQGYSTTELQRLHGEALLSLKTEQDAREVAANAAKNDQILEEERKRAREQAEITQGLMSIMGDLFAISASDADEAADYKKMMTLFEIAIDTASAISSLTAASEANPANGVTSGAAGIVQWVTGIARITANIAKAKDLLAKPKPKAPAFAIGGATGASATGLPKRGSSISTGTSVEEVMSYFDESLGTTVSITKPPRDISLGGVVGEPTVGLFGEAGSEWVAPNWQFQHPTLQPVFTWLEDMRLSGRVPAYAVGGPTGAENYTSSPPAVVRKAIGDAPVDQPPAYDIKGLTAVIDKLNGILEIGITSTITNDQLVRNNERLDSITNSSNLTA